MSSSREFANQRVRIRSHFLVIGPEKDLHSNRRSLGIGLVVTLETMEACFEPQGVEVTDEFVYFAHWVWTAGPTPDGRHGVQDMRIAEAICEATKSDSARAI